MCIDMCAGMCADMCIDTCMDMWTDNCAVCGRVRLVYTASKTVYTYVCTHMCMLCYCTIDTYVHLYRHIQPVKWCSCLYKCQHIVALLYRHVTHVCILCTCLWTCRCASLHTSRCIQSLYALHMPMYTSMHIHAHTSVHALIHMSMHMPAHMHARMSKTHTRHRVRRPMRP